MRSKYIYLIYKNGQGPHSSSPRLLSVHTVKHEAHTWVLRSIWAPESLTLWRALDGLSGLPTGKTFTMLEWEL